MKESRPSKSPCLGELWEELQEVRKVRPNRPNRANKPNRTNGDFFMIGEGVITLLRDSVITKGGTDSLPPAGYSPYLRGRVKNYLRGGVGEGELVNQRQ